jgi:hypothetical protein
MKLPTVFKQFSVIETILLFSFIVFIIFPINVPSPIAHIIESPLGMVIILGIVVSLFILTNPILGVIYILVAYELLRRSSTAVRGSVIRHSQIPHVAKHHNINNDTKGGVANNIDVSLPILNRTLEEDIISKRAPIGRSDSNTFIDTNFKPVSDNSLGGSMF